MTFTAAIRTCFAKYFTFSGRATRSEYWWFFLFILLGSFVAGIFDAILFGAGEVANEATDEPVAVEAQGNGPLASLFSLVTFLPMLSSGWRRMHDTGRSGLYLLYPIFAMLGLATFVGFAAGFENLFSGDVSAVWAGGFGIILILAIVVIAISPLIVLFWLTRPSQQGANQFGPNPHEVTQ